MAENTDIVVVFAGLPESFESEGYDRAHMRLPEEQNELIQMLAQAGHDVVVVLQNGAPVEMPWIQQVKAVLEAYLGGLAVGSGLSDILSG